MIHDKGIVGRTSRFSENLITFFIFAPGAVITFFLCLATRKSGGHALGDLGFVLSGWFFGFIFMITSLACVAFMKCPVQGGIVYLCFCLLGQWIIGPRRAV